LEAAKNIKTTKMGRTVNPVSNSTLPDVISMSEGAKNLKISSIRKDIPLPGHSATEKILTGKGVICTFISQRNYQKLADLNHTTQCQNSNWFPNVSITSVFLNIYS
jgi:hypothetical protein